MNPLKQAEILKNMLSDQAKNHFVLEWRGSKIPRGATIGGIKIGWTQHGMISGESGEDLGTYKRSVEFGGEHRDAHIMTISTDHEDVVPPEGGRAQKTTQ